MKTSPVVIAALMSAASAAVVQDVQEAQVSIHKEVADMVSPEKVKKFNQDLINWDRSIRQAAKTVRKDITKYDLKTRKPKLAIDK
jgi:hypothetical protein